MSSAQEQYLQKAIPWPRDGAKGFILISRGFNQTRAVGSIADALKLIDTIKANDTFVCQSLQSDPNQRLKNNALALKSLFMDIDFDSYNSIEEAEAGIKKFRQSFTLAPNITIFTGGGYHFYWVCKDYITPEKWFPLAHALVEAAHRVDLKCDGQVTVDAARILRVPDTFNVKRGKHSELREILPDYDWPTLDKALLPFRVKLVRYANGSHPDLSQFPAKSDKVENDLSAGIKPELKITLVEVAAECPLIADTIATGGANQQEPLWFSAVKVAGFLVEGREAAHTLSKGHKRYTEAETNAKFDRAIREQSERDFGWPQCQTIYGNGSTFCKACPHFVKGKSPISIARDKQKNIYVPPLLPVPKGNTTSVLPSGYIRDERGRIIYKFIGEDGKIEQRLVCDTPIGNAWVQSDPWVLNFTAEVVPGKPIHIQIPFETIVSPEWRKELGRQGIVVGPQHAKLMGDFLVSWIKTLKETKDAVVSTAPFGWNTNENGLEGFVYGGTMFTPSGTKVAQPPDAVTSRGYTPKGSEQPWINAAKLITDQQRSALNTILASTFAAPLVRFTNMRGLMLSCIGESGIGKSTALDVALSVWGHPLKAKNLLHDTDNSVMNKMGELRSLPIFWDDLQPDDTHKYARMVFQNSYGRERDRMNVNIKRRESGTWQTIMVSTSNYSLLEYVVRHTNYTTTAGVYRIFEIPVDAGVIGQIAKTDAARIVGKLDDNFGRIGERYAEYLGNNFLALEDEVITYQKALDEEINATNPERNWTSLMACVCVGAKISNRLGFTNTIDEPALRGFLLTCLGKMREELKNSAVDMSQDINVTQILSSFLNACRGRNTLFTNVIHKGRGKPALGSVRILHDTSKLDSIKVHIGMEDKLMRITKNDLCEWLDAKNIPHKPFLDKLKEKGMTQINGHIASGTTLVVPSLAYILELSLIGFMEAIDINEIFEEVKPAS